MTTYFAEENQTADPGTYAATCTAIAESTEDGPYGPFLEWAFAVDAGGSGTIEVTGRSGVLFKRGTKARDWYESLLGRELVGREAIDLDAVLGRPANLTLSVKTTPKGEFNRIEDVRPPKQRPAAAAPGSAQAMVQRMAAQAADAQAQVFGTEPDDYADAV